MIKQKVFFTSLRNSEDPRIDDNRALILLSKKTARTGTFSAQGGGNTDPCAGCVIIHEFLDHGKPWMSGQKDNNVVTAHNKALKIKGSKQRDGKDHD